MSEKGHNSKNFFVSGGMFSFSLCFILVHMCSNITEAVKIENKSSLIFSSKNISSTLCQFFEGETGPEQIQFVEKTQSKTLVGAKLLNQNLQTIPPPKKKN